MVENDKIAEEVCTKQGHDYTNSMACYWRDSQGKAFKGFGQNTAPQSQTWVCRRCGGTVEVVVNPQLEKREGPAITGAPKAAK